MEIKIPEDIAIASAIPYWYRLINISYIRKSRTCIYIAHPRHLKGGAWPNAILFSA